MGVLNHIVQPVLSSVLVATLVSCSIEDDVYPLLTSAEVGLVGADKLRLIYDVSLDEGSVPAAVDYSLSGTTVGVSSVAISGDTVTLTLDDYINAQSTISVDYTAGSNPVQDAIGTNAGNLSGQSVINNVGYYWVVDMNGDVVLDMEGEPIPT